MNWRAILAESNDLDIRTDLLVCADWCEENGRMKTAAIIRAWADEEPMIIDGEPFVVAGWCNAWMSFSSLFKREERIDFDYLCAQPEGPDLPALVVVSDHGKRSQGFELPDDYSPLDALRWVRKRQAEGYVFVHPDELTSGEGL